MGQRASLPTPGTSIQVIGAGLSRTGTTSFSQALEILLNGPVYHCGTQSTLGLTSHLQTWITILQHWLSDPANSKSTNTNNDAISNANTTPNPAILTLLSTQLDGYAAVTDAPGAQFTPELLTLYPHAIVICTTRDPTTWEASFAQIISLMTNPLLPWVLLPLPGMVSYFRYLALVGAQWDKLYGEMHPTRRSYERHVAWLKRVVPGEKLVFFDVRDGWGPLCEALGKAVPVDVPFPHVNDVEAFGGLVREKIRRGLLRWAVILGVVGVLAAVGLRR